MSWKNEFEEYLRQVSGEPMDILLDMNDWFHKKIDQSNVPSEQKKLCIGHITVLKHWVKEHGINVPGLPDHYFDSTKKQENNSQNISTVLRNYRFKLE